jgi:serine/threonine-protein kinase
MRLPERYQLLDQGESGGFGRVVRATDTWLERELAIKILDPVLALEGVQQERFLQEARTLARLSHPNIPAIYDVVFDTEVDPPLFQLIFEYVEGQTLHAWMEDNGPVPIERAKVWFSQLASALEHAHLSNIVHRDLKPENVIIRASGETACVVDWGIALSSDEAKRLTRSGYVIGTPGYMSPEQMAGDEIDQRTDIYNLGLCLYEALSGTPPHIGGDYQELSDIDESIPVPVDDLIKACLRERSTRIDSATTFASELNAALVTRLALSSVLNSGTLADLASALRNMDANEFAEHPRGQQMLIITKAVDLAESQDPRLEVPCASLISELVRLATRIEPDEYVEILDLALVWGFERVYGNGDRGKEFIRRSLAKEAPQLPHGASRVAAQATTRFFEHAELSDWEPARLVGARELLDGLLSNRTCPDDLAPTLAARRREVDRAQRARSGRSG